MGCCGGSQPIETSFENTQFDFQDLQSIVKKYKGVEGSLISILQEVQEVYNYLPVEALNYIAQETGIKPTKIHGVATFYTQFRLKPIGKYLIMLCQGTACHVNGSKLIEQAICEELNIKEGETTEDNLFTLNNVACLGCCSLSPVMMINGETYGKLTPEMTKNILRDIKNNAEKGA
ncbi:NADH-quinone oxidoreductase subunit NuoE [Clostridium formicaceticum]|uniref:NAD(P)H-dependent oxidoreductase subunit E n=1 Tax=Clostridium formicaceticum TaxID=1497 RepID=A0AAC9WF59_9CLOT|nr:NADH-quinone oxidoreductase subunit NuoE [Clostridium formicaceticum]AOY76160.1 NAD(P)H-dependent oxidoreductase subunit E [Clostridium formicaceticum]ARE86532.1 NADP-reducing hydrogenase subunit HndA [Clostridium formicaceticum]